MDKPKHTKYQDVTILEDYYDNTELLEKHFSNNDNK